MPSNRLKIFVTLLVAVWLVIPAAVSANGEDATGADDIFELVGREKPAAWSDWTREKRFEHLQGMGIYPPDSREKYKGQINNLDLYFEKLGIEQPTNWADLTFEERSAIVGNAQKALVEIDLAKEFNRNEAVSIQEPPSNINMKIILAILGTILGSAIIFASYKVDWLRANKSK